MYTYDEAVLKAFVDKQEQLYSEAVAATLEEADDFLCEVMAVVVDSKQAVWDYFVEECIDVDGADKDSIVEADEVFDIGDGRYLIVEA